MEKSTIEIPNDIIQPIVEAKVQAAMIEALGGYERLVETAVAQVLNQKVDPTNGQPERYSNSQNPTWFKWAMNDCVKRAARAVNPNEHTNED